MTTSRIIDLLDSDWNEDNATKPNMIKFPEEGSYHNYKQAIVEKPESQEDDYMGVFDSDYFSSDSLDVSLIWVVGTSKSNAESYISEIKRICSVFSPSGDDKILKWENGSWLSHTGVRWVFTMRIGISKAGAQISL